MKVLNDTRSAAGRLRRKPLLWGVGALVCLLVAGIIGGNYYVQAHTVVYYNVYKDGKAVGSVESPEQVEALLTQLKEEAQKKSPHARMVLEVGELTFEPVEGYKAVPETEQTLAAISEQVETYAQGVAVRVDGKLIGIARDQAAANRVLKLVQAQYVPEAPGAPSPPPPPQVQSLSYGAADMRQRSGDAASGLQSDERSLNGAQMDEPELHGLQSDEPMSHELISVTFLEEIHTAGVPVDPARVSSEEELFERLVVSTAKPTQYTVQDGDCVSCIASKFDISRELIYRNNPWIVDDLLKVGDVLDLTVRQPQLTVQTVERVAELAEIAPPVEVRSNPDMRAGQTEVIQQGQPGEKRMVFEQVRQNGLLMQEELIEEEILKEPVPEIVMKGTKIVGEGSGKFRMPVKNARVTSHYGMRWGRMHRGIDLVGNRQILAADHGVVEFVGTRNAYGRMVILDHKNGYKTVYAHLRSYSVKKGDIVEKGDQLGVMGSTGRSTGVHLHFEIRKNGDYKNPWSYLS